MTARRVPPFPLAQRKTEGIAMRRIIKSSAGLALVGSLLGGSLAVTEEARAALVSQMGPVGKFSGVDDDGSPRRSRPNQWRGPR